MRIKHLALAITISLVAPLGLAVMQVPAYSINCTNRSTSLYQGWDDFGHAEMVGRVKASCSGGGTKTISLEILEHKTGWPDDPVAYAEWRSWSGNALTKYLRGCDTDDGRFFAKSHISGHGYQESSKDPWHHCDKK